MLSHWLARARHRYAVGKDDTLPCSALLRSDPAPGKHSGQDLAKGVDQLALLSLGQFILTTLSHACICRAKSCHALARSSAHFASDLVEWTDMRHSDGYANLRLRRPA
jgi:hypothetical protein